MKPFYLDHKEHRVIACRHTAGTPCDCMDHYDSAVQAIFDDLAAESPDFDDKELWAKAEEQLYWDMKGGDV